MVAEMTTNALETAATVEDQLVEALAAHGRVYLLWEFDAAGAMGKLGFNSGTGELDVDPEEATFEEVVEAYVESLDIWFEDAASEDHELWLESAEQEYGGLVDAVMDFYDAGK